MFFQTTNNRFVENPNFRCDDVKMSWHDENFFKLSIMNKREVSKILPKFTEAATAKYVSKLGAWNLFDVEVKGRVALDYLDNDADTLALPIGDYFLASGELLVGDSTSVLARLFKEQDQRLFRVQFYDANGHKKSNVLGAYKYTFSRK